MAYWWLQSLLMANTFSIGNPAFIYSGCTLSYCAAAGMALNTEQFHASAAENSTGKQGANKREPSQHKPAIRACPPHYTRPYVEGKTKQPDHDNTKHMG